MNEKNLFKRPKMQPTSSIESSWHNLSGQDEITKLINVADLMPSDNPYPISDLEDLIDSIKQYGLEQNLVVQQSKEIPNKYLIISGERRYRAIKNILENDKDEIYEHLNQVYCKVMADDVDPVLVKLRLHETNLQTRPLLKMPEEEKLSIIESYIRLIEEAREKKIEINGKVVKGKTRDLVAEKFNISSRQAGYEIKKIKEGGKNATQEEFNSSTELNESAKIEKQIKTITKSLEKAYVFLSDYFNDLEEDQQEKIKNLLIDLEDITK